jgi:molybdenum cofactor cytidylyltransferase
MSVMRIVAIVPAAGRSARFGGPKLVADVDGAPLLDRTLAALLDVPAVDRVVVVTANGATMTDVARLLDPRVTTVINPDPSPGMLSSIQVGVAAAVEADILMLLPADMPFVAPSSVARVAAAAVRAPDAIVVPTHDGQRGHPIAMPARLRALILHARPDSTLKDVLANSGAPREELELDDTGILRDVDVPADLDRPV